MINEISELAKGGGELTMPSSDEFETPIQERRGLIPTPEELKAEQKELDAKLQVKAAQMALAAHKKYVASLGKQSTSGPLTEQDLGEGRMRTFVDAILRKSGWKPHHIFDGREYWGWTLVPIEDKC
jgi:hypothetical protein